MNKKITFLLGAGASCNAMPLTANLPTRMKGIIDLIDNENFPPSSPLAQVCNLCHVMYSSSPLAQVFNLCHGMYSSLKLFAIFVL